jgi:hypothetical protein
MKNWKLVLSAVCLLVLVYFGAGEYRIENYLSQQERVKLSHIGYADAKEELGIVIEEYVAKDYWLGKQRMWWVVKVPKSNQRWTCEWQSGFVGFRRGDSVRLLHHMDADGSETDDIEGLLIASERADKGKIASVYVSDTDEQEYQSYLKDASDSKQIP